MKKFNKKSPFPEWKMVTKIQKKKKKRTIFKQRLTLITKSNSNNNNSKQIQPTEYY